MYALASTNGKGVKVIRYNRKESQLIGPLIYCYQQVFAGPPWNEWKKCSNSDCPDPLGYWGNKDREQLIACGFVHCGKPMVDYWSSDQVKIDLEHELTDETSC